jgi:hypothetical protein
MEAHWRSALWKHTREDENRVWEAHCSNEECQMGLTGAQIYMGNVLESIYI